MNHRSRQRRTLLRSGAGAVIYAGLVAAGWIKPGAASAQTWNKDAFESHALADARKALGASDAAQSIDVAFVQTPEIAENGAVVPIEITSNVPGTTSIAVIADKNPFPLVAQFRFQDGAVPFVKLNIKMGETSEVRAIAQAGGKSYVATKEIKVTIGGCGG